MFSNEYKNFYYYMKIHEILLKKKGVCLFAYKRKRESFEAKYIIGRNSSNYT